MIVGNADTLAADEARRQVPAGAYAAARPILAGGRESQAEVAP